MLRSRSRSALLICHGSLALIWMFCFIAIQACLVFRNNISYPQFAFRFLNESPSDISPKDQSSLFSDSSRYPRRIDLEISAETLERLQELASRSGRSLSELAQELFDRALGDY